MMVRRKSFSEPTHPERTTGLLLPVAARAPDSADNSVRHQVEPSSSYSLADSLGPLQQRRTSSGPGGTEHAPVELAEALGPLRRRRESEAKELIGSSLEAGSPEGAATIVQLEVAQDRSSAIRAPGDEVAIREAAEQGVQTPSTRLPYLEQVQTLFGRHDVSGIEAHLGDAATSSARAMHAQAYATGNHVVFAGTPDLHTTAHEAAHVVQQRGGVQLAGGVGQVGDVYEQHADAVADRVVAGQSAEALLDQFAGMQRDHRPEGSGAAVGAVGAASGAVQRSMQHVNDYGPSDGHAILPYFANQHVLNNPTIDQAVQHHDVRGDLEKSTLIDMSENEAQEDIHAYLLGLADEYEPPDRPWINTFNSYAYVQTTQTHIVDQQAYEDGQDWFAITWDGHEASVILGDGESAPVGGAETAVRSGGSVYIAEAGNSVMNVRLQYGHHGYQIYHLGQVGAF